MQEKFTILVADDDADDRLLIEDAFQENECSFFMEDRYGLIMPDNSTEAGAFEVTLRNTISEAPGFCESYMLGRFLIIEERYVEAIEVLESIPLDSNSDFLEDNALLNLIGFAHLKTNNLELAVENFRRQTEIKVSNKDQMKTLNNLGYALILLGRYDEARESLEKAVNLGSEKAAFNLARVDSVVESLTAQDPSVPGAFAAVVAYERKPDDIQAVRSAIARKLGVSPVEVQVFTLDEDRYYFTYGAYLSYLKAEERMAEAAAAGISGAWLTLTSEWTDITDSLS